MPTCLGNRKARGRGGGDSSKVVMDPRTRENEARGLRWINMVITLIRGWIWTDLTMFPSGSSVRMGVSSKGSEL